jgi:hypothetical protein
MDRTTYRKVQKVHALYGLSDIVSTCMSVMCASAELLQLELTMCVCSKLLE